MIDFTVQRESGMYTSTLLRVMVSKERKADRMFRFYASDMASVFAQLAEEMQAVIHREQGESYFLVSAHELGDLQALIMGHGCSVQLLDTVQKSDTASCCNH